MLKGDLVYLVGKKGGNPWRYAMGIVQNPDEWGHVRVLTLKMLDESVLPGAGREGSTGLYRKEALELVYEDQLAGACGQ